MHAAHVALRMEPLQAWPWACVALGLCGQVVEDVCVCVCTCVDGLLHANPNHNQFPAFELGVAGWWVPFERSREPERTGAQDCPVWGALENLECGVKTLE
jgi:hypothetical protein